MGNIDQADDDHDQGQSQSTEGRLSRLVLTHSFTFIVSPTPHTPIPIHLCFTPTMAQVIYNGDTRYPAPPAYAPPAGIGGIPTQAELDAFPKMFTWGELKEIVRESGRFDFLSSSLRRACHCVGLVAHFGTCRLL
jgi:hypothetical protein